MSVQASVDIAEAVLRGNQEPIRQHYSVGTPFVVDVPYDDGSEPIYEPFELPEEGRFSAVFQLPEGVQPTAESLSELFMPDKLIDAIVVSTNEYARSWMPLSKVKEVDRGEILRFFAIVFYMGLVKLPAKKDYWRNGSNLWPAHPITAQMSCNRFEYIWRNVHMAMMEPELAAEEDAQEEGVDDEEEFDEVETEPTVNDQPEDKRWYEKAALLVDHCNYVAQLVCRHPSFSCSIDEMMKLFKGRWKQTHRMKCKPIKEGYKFYANCCAQTGFIYHFVPDGRGARKGKLSDLTVELLEILPQRTNKQYVVGMDNLFTTPQVMGESRELGVGIVGTARYRRGWPTKEMRAVTDIRFNTVHRQVDRDNYLVCRWIDNNVVTMVTTVHTGDERVKSVRCKPRTNDTNKHHVERLWGRRPAVNIFIPKVIDDYNHWMNGCDKADQLIAYYHPNIRCRRTWMPIMMHCLDVLRVNAYIVCKEAGPNKKILHKTFLESWINALLVRAQAEKERITRRSSSLDSQGSSAKKKRAPKRQRMSKHNPTLPPERLLGDRSTHHKGIDSENLQRACVYCSYLHSLDKKHGEDPPHTVKRSTRKCITCNVHLCMDHFDDYHGYE